VKKIFFSYIKPTKFSGQTAATILIIDSMRERGYECRTIKLYPLQRSIQNVVKRWFNLISKQVRSIPDIFNLLFTNKPVLHLTLGQGIMSFVRIAVWLVPVKMLRRDMKMISSLNGNTFMNWDRNEFKTKFFLYFIKGSESVTVLGKRQKEKLISFGIPGNQIRIIPNACELSPVSEAFTEKKHAKDKITVLHLSLLIESKGFPEYLEAAQLMAEANPDQKIDFILCGPVSFTSYCKIFKTVEEKTKWIEEKIQNINAISENVSARWISGARGKEKEVLFQDAQIFVMPTTFPVEAQPLVLLEAMAGGCAIISSRVGEIESILNSENSILIDDTGPESIFKEISKLMINRGKRKKLALNGLNDIKGPLSLESYTASWEDLLNKL